MNLFLIFLPFASFFISGLFALAINYNPHKKHFLNFISWVISLILLGSATIFYVLLWLKLDQNADFIVIDFMNWFVSGNLYINLSLIYNVFTLSMISLVCFISLLVHFYSYFYMDKEENIARFLAYLSLFTFSMLLLVSANNLMQMFIGWEAISLCSYLLILFWFKDDVKVKGANKAFLINRFADIAFVLGIFSTFVLFGNLNFFTLKTLNMTTANIYFSFLSYNISLIDVICILFLIASFAKSAQFFFHIWLPDAMEAPTPVSALLHAATMVTAGVFLTIKLADLYALSPFSSNVIFVVSSITILVGAILACVQTDIKKIIAYSTVSQLGYMFLALANNFYNGAFFHLFTHAFFKALLFLSAGSVIHALSGEQNITKMGNLWKKIPITYLSMLIGSFALIGIPSFSGFYSKEFILNSLFFNDTPYGSFAYYCALIGVFFSAYYSFRLLILVFHSKQNYDSSLHVHESSIGILFVLVILAIFSIFAGKFFMNDFVGSSANVYWQEAMSIGNQIIVGNFNHNIEYTTLGLIVLAFIITYFVYYKNFDVLNTQNSFVNLFHKLFVTLFFVDWIYDNIIVKSFNKLAKFLVKFDDNVVDKYLPNSTAGMLVRLSGVFNKMQIGYVNIYAIAMVLGLFLMLTYFFIMGF
jgi:NADH-quinone oxidoreductase subunit L